MKSRAQLAAEPRTMQFVVERNGCPIRIGKDIPPLAKPEVIWVTLDEPVDPNPFEGSCSGKKYAVVPADAARADEYGRTSVYACEHMGRLIE